MSRNASYPVIITSREVIIAGALIFKMGAYRFVDVYGEEVNRMKKMQFRKALKMQVSTG